ncbi:hypothetical protein [Streptomyces sp. NPDC048825]|uniref:hypothetical protein n=1 Tax=Streptomyces sp. NPDC048825 TaxID=3365592 RepID=UPI0037193DE7
MITYIIALSLAVVGGSVGTWLTFFRDRVRLDLNLISITKCRNPEDTVLVGDGLMEAAKSFGLSDLNLERNATESRIQDIRSRAQDVEAEAPRQIEFARGMQMRLWQCRAQEEKAEFVYSLMNDGPLVFSEIVTGLRSGKLVLSELDQGATHQPEVCSVVSRHVDSTESVVLTFPDGRSQSIPIDPPEIEEQVKHLAATIQAFDVDRLDKCLRYAITTLRSDLSWADILTGGLKNIVDSSPFMVELMIVNKGSRAAILSPYAALRTRGAHSKIPPTDLRVESIHDGRNEPAAVRGSSWVAIEPHAAVTLILRSGPVEATAPLSAAFDKGLLRCSIALARLKSWAVKSVKYKKEKTVYKDFGANIDKAMLDKVKELVGQG